MQKKILLAIASVISTSLPLAAGELEEPSSTALTDAASQSADTKQQQPSKPFASFTGKINKSKVRMRLQPSLDSPIIRELEQGDMIIVVDEDDEFYAVDAPEDVHAYIFRTYVLDGTVEGHNVNVRLEPTLDSPIIAQLNSGDTVRGRVSPVNSKWLEIDPPSTTRFFVSKDYIEKIGDSTFMAKMQKRRDAVNQLLDAAYKSSQASSQIPFNQINYDEIVAKYEKVIRNYPEFEQQVARAQDLLTNFKEDYTKRKISHLEAKSQEFANNEELQKENSKLSQVLRKQQEQLITLKSQLDSSPRTQQAADAEPAIAAMVSEWLPNEEALFKEWLVHNEGTLDDFYKEQAERSTSLRGTLEPYTRNVRNRPGDYVLLNHNRIPIAFIYSTRLNLQDYLGQEITVAGASRANNNFAYPAYFVLTIQ